MNELRVDAHDAARGRRKQEVIEPPLPFRIHPRFHHGARKCLVLEMEEALFALPRVRREIARGGVEEVLDRELLCARDRNRRDEDAILDAVEVHRLRPALLANLRGTEDRDRLAADLREIIELPNFRGTAGGGQGEQRGAHQDQPDTRQGQDGVHSCRLGISVGTATRYPARQRDSAAAAQEKRQRDKAAVDALGREAQVEGRVLAGVDDVHAVDCEFDARAGRAAIAVFMRMGSSTCQDKMLPRRGESRREARGTRRLPQAGWVAKTCLRGSIIVQQIVPKTKNAPMT